MEKIPSKIKHFFYIEEDMANFFEYWKDYITPIVSPDQIINFLQDYFDLVLTEKQKEEINKEEKYSIRKTTEIINSFFTG